jgi:hypothetical protein
MTIFFWPFVHGSAGSRPKGNVAGVYPICPELEAAEGLEETGGFEDFVVFDVFCFEDEGAVGGRWGLLLLLFAQLLMFGTF